MKGKTKTGFRFEISKDLANDAEFLEAAVDAQDGQGGEVFLLIRMALGEEQKKALYDHCRGEDGVVPLDRVAEEMKDIFEAFNEDPKGKN